MRVLAEIFVVGVLIYFGDNLEWLRDRHGFPDASVSLVYLDPPFDSNADYTSKLLLITRP